MCSAPLMGNLLRIQEIGLKEERIAVCLPIDGVVMDHLYDADKLLVKLTKFVPPVFSFIYFRDSQMHESPR